jgi:hypothetical protein
MVAFVTSYLFGEDSVHLNSLYWRPGNRTDHFYTRKAVPGRRFGPDKPVYVLHERIDAATDPERKRRLEEALAGVEGEPSGSWRVTPP